MNSLFNALTRPSARRGALLFLAAALAGCGRSNVEVYQVAKDSAQPPATQAMAAAQMAGPGAGALPSLQWKLPAGWQEAPAGQMRLASFRVAGDNGKQADVSVVPLPGLAGRDLDNVNRWRGQVGLSPITEEEMTKQAESLEIAGQKAQLYDQAGQAPGSGEKSRILAALMRKDGIAWFFKMTGDDELVGRQKPAFVDFLKSITFTAPADMPELPPSHPPIGGTMGSPGATPALLSAATAANPEKPAWQVPAGWQEAPGGQFLVAKFTISGNNGEQAAVNVSTSSGEGGGVAGNVNRWRGQLGLGEVPQGEVEKLVTPLDLPSGKAMLVDMSGTDGRTGQKTRLVGAIVPQAGQTWFYKLMGNESLVEREKAAFTQFVKGVQYTGAK